MASKTTKTQAPGRPGGRTRPRGSRQKALLAAEILAAKKAQDTVVLDLRKLTLIADYFVVCTGISETHVRALAQELLERFKELRLPSAAAQGVADGHWALLDFGDVIVHIFGGFERGFYDLERLWGDAPVTEVA